MPNEQSEGAEAVAKYSSMCTEKAALLYGMVVGFEKFMDNVAKSEGMDCYEEAHDVWRAIGTYFSFCLEATDAK